MSLIQSNRPTPEDVAAWSRLERGWLVHSRLNVHARQVERAEHALAEFAHTGHCYCGVSWGKDSVVVADMAQRISPTVPLVWVRVEGIENPDCFLVRDSFLIANPSADYHEIAVSFDGSGSGRLSEGFRAASKRFGPRYVSGVRGDESSSRARRVAAFGESSRYTCAPLSRWSADDVFAYLAVRELPVAPAYACTLGGKLDPRRLRIASLGGDRGSGHGRAGWEWRYYPEEMSRLFPVDTRPR